MLKAAREKLSKEQVKPRWEQAVQEGKTVVYLKGDWSTLALHAVNKSSFPAQVDVLDGSELAKLDATGACVIRYLLTKANQEDTAPQWRYFTKAQLKLLEWVTSFTAERPRLLPIPPLWQQMIAGIGYGGIRALKTLPAGISFLGQLVVSLGRSLINPKRLRFNITIDQLSHVGVRAVPIVSLIAFLIGVVLTFQGAFQLRRFGAELFTVDLLAISVLREVGVLLTAIVVAGRSGSAYAAQIGTMNLNQEVDALRTMGIDIIDFLVVPRILALLIALPLLTFLANAVAMVGGSLMAFWVLDISYTQFVKQFQQALTPWTFWIGLIKAPFFAFLIAMVGCYEGLCVKGSAESVGTRTTKAVVEGIFLVIVCDALFSILFAVMGV